MTALSYADIYLTPRYSTLRSRSDADVSVEFLGRRFALPICLSNMSSVINVDIAKWMSEHDMFYIYHRFTDTRAFVERANKENWRTISISVGVKQADKDILTLIAANKWCIDFITIDVAMGHHVLVKEMLAFIRSLGFALQGTQGWPTRIIAGNVATPEAVRDLALWGADACKVGVGGGKSCSTKDQTGFHVPMFSCALESCKDSPIPIILDGGIRYNGDIAKALVAGMSVCHQAILVMAGSLFAACEDAPGETIVLPSLTNSSILHSRV